MTFPHCLRQPSSSFKQASEAGSCRDDRANLFLFIATEKMYH
jgi:hypothetical protein